MFSSKNPTVLTQFLLKEKKEYSIYLYIIITAIIALIISYFYFVVKNDSFAQSPKIISFLLFTIIFCYVCMRIYNKSIINIKNGNYDFVVFDNTSNIGKIFSLIYYYLLTILSVIVWSVIMAIFIYIILTLFYSTSKVLESKRGNLFSFEFDKKASIPLRIFSLYKFISFAIIILIVPFLIVVMPMIYFFDEEKYPFITKLKLVTSIIQIIFIVCIIGFIFMSELLYILTEKLGLFAKFSSNIPDLFKYYKPNYQNVVHIYVLVFGLFLSIIAGIYSCFKKDDEFNNSFKNSYYFVTLTILFIYIILFLKSK